MDKRQFLEFLKNPRSASEDDLEAFEEIARKYPYFQPVRLFIAKLARDLDQPGQKEKLNVAAIYTANRAILKEAIEANWETQPSPAFRPAENEPKTTENSMSETPINEPAQPQEALDQQGGEIPVENAGQHETAMGQEAADSLSTPGESVLSESSGAQNVPDEISEKKRQQMEIIDSFINYESQLARRKFVKPEDIDAKPQEDLSLRSSRLGDDIVSENLAMILKKQGKIDKAIDIYKKLIWKFPQKKAYFASLIEELKKN